MFLDAIKTITDIKDMLGKLRMQFQQKYENGASSSEYFGNYQPNDDSDQKAKVSKAPKSSTGGPESPSLQPDKRDGVLDP